jgi:hypothetical protein
MKVYWKIAPRPGNFGDILTPLFLDYFGINYTYSKEQYDTVAIGSLASMTKPGTRVLGSGIISRYYNVSPLAIWEFVRGPITRQRVLERGGQCPEIYGDLAMLLPLICEPSKKEHNIGIVPHYADYDIVTAAYPNYHVINVLNADPLAVAREITKCDLIVSSSLHGIICAHAYGIPTAWMKFGGVIKGDDIKFKDHYAAMNLDCHRSTWNDLRFSTPSFDITPIVDVMRTLAYEQNSNDDEQE